MVKVLLTIPGIENDVVLCSPDVKVITIKKREEGEVEVEGLKAGVGAEIGEEGRGRHDESEGKEKEGDKMEEVAALELGKKMSSLHITNSENFKEGGTGLLEYKIQFNLPDISALFLEENPDFEVSDLPDDMDIRVMIDGESYVPPRLASNILLFDKVDIGSISNPKGGFGFNVPVRLM